MPPLISHGAANREGALTDLAAEMMSEQASNLGRMGRNVERALTDLAAAAPEHRPARLDAAADAVWRYFIQREVAGVRNHAPAIADYRIPGAVLARLGARPRKS